MNLALIVFARAPLPGTVKTRLIPVLGAQGAARLYGGLLEHALDLATSASFASTQLYAADPASMEFFKAQVPAAHFTLALQVGADLGARMHHALTAELGGHAGVLLMGTDLVDTSVNDLLLAGRWLATDAEVVLGPTADGGYWLIGLRQPCPVLFDALPWGSSTIYASTVARLAAAEMTWRALPLRHDIDTPADLLDYSDELAALGF